MTPINIKAPEGDTLSEELIRFTKTSNGDAVKTALRREIASRKGSLPMWQPHAWSGVSDRNTGLLTLI